MGIETYTPHELIDDIEAHGKDLTSWELGFVDKVSTWIGRGYGIKPETVDKLREIHEQRVG